MKRFISLSTSTFNSSPCLNFQLLSLPQISTPLPASTFNSSPCLNFQLLSLTQLSTPLPASTFNSSPCLKFQHLSLPQLSTPLPASTFNSSPLSLSCILISITTYYSSLFLPSIILNNSTVFGISSSRRGQISSQD